MEKSLRGKIMDNILTSLEAVRGPATGYNTELDRVARWEQDFNPLQYNACAVIYPDSEDKAMEPDPEATCSLNMFVLFFFRHDKERYDMSTDEALEFFLADIEKAIMQDHTRGGNAITTSMLGNEPFESVEGQPYAGIIIRFSILYEHNFKDPYN